MNPKNPNLRNMLKNLVDKFTGGQTSELISSLWPELHLDCPVLRSLKLLSNSMDNEIRSKSSSRDIDHVYTNIISCAISEKKPQLTHVHFKRAGWLFGKQRYTTARKRLREETFFNLRPAKRGRQAISKELQVKIRDF